VWDEADRRRVQYDGYTRVVEALLPPPCAVLDAGCGDGWLAARLARANYEVWGLDYSERAIGFARLLADAATFRHFDLRQLVAEDPFDRQFAAALLVEVLEHIPPADHEGVLAGLHRMIEPGGCLVMCVPSVHLTPVNRWHYMHFSLDQVRSLVERAGFVITDVVCQRRQSPLWSARFWRFVQNRYYDLRVVRRGLRYLLLTYRNLTDDPARAGRYVIKGVKPARADS
jgi:SAM-dependent methyltransferase